VWFCGRAAGLSKQSIWLGSLGASVGFLALWVLAYGIVMQSLAPQHYWQTHLSSFQRQKLLRFGIGLTALPCRHRHWSATGILSD